MTARAMTARADAGVRIATRSSALALAQATLVADALAAAGLATELVTAATTGDTDRRELTEIGGAGVFVGEVRAAVLSGRADVAVHSAKDLPVAVAPGLILAAVPPRADVADVLVVRAAEWSTGPGAASGQLLAGLPAGARIGTGSPRRAAQLRALAAAVGLDVEVVPVRGNVDTRLRLVSAGTVDAVVVAAAGLARLGRGAAPLPGLLARRLPVATALPAPAQGALAVECRTDAPDWLRQALAGLDDLATRTAVTAERAVLVALDAGCLTPVGALAEAVGPGRLRLRACLAGVDGQLDTVTVIGDASRPEAIGAEAGVLLGARPALASSPHLVSCPS